VVFDFDFDFVTGRFSGVDGAGGVGGRGSGDPGAVSSAQRRTV